MIAHDLCAIFPEMSDDQLDELVADIAKNGLIDPIIMYEGAILDGRHRHIACARAKVQPRYEDFQGTDALSFVISKNLSRRHLDESQRAMISARIANLGPGHSKKNSPIGAVSQPESAIKLNVSERSVQRAQKVLSTGTQALAKAVDDGRVAVSVAAKIACLSEDDQAKVLADKRPDQAIKKVARARKEEALAGQSVQASFVRGSKRYGVIYADPPWRFDVYSQMTGMDRSAENHYPTMTTEDIYNLEIPSDENCVLFLWATIPMLPEALNTMQAWGFEYDSQFVWTKDRIGLGYWVRERHELLLIGTKGYIPAPAPGEQFDSVIEHPRGKHSEKPEVVYEHIEKMFPNLPKLELFARTKRKGWDQMGNEA